MSNIIKNGVKGNPLNAFLNLFNYQVDWDTCEAFNNVGQLRKIAADLSNTAVVLPQEVVRLNSFRLPNNGSDAFKKLAKIEVLCQLHLVLYFAKWLKIIKLLPMLPYLQ